MVPEVPVVLPEREVEFAANAVKLISNYKIEILNGELTLVGLVEKLGELLSSSDEFKRYQGTYILSGVLEELPPRLLSTKETSTLATFYCEKIKDHFMLLPPALRGLVTLVKMDNLMSDVPSTIFETLGNSVACQALTYSDRLIYYSLFEAVINHKKEDALRMGEEFLKQLVSCMDGESDPRNLMFLFRILPAIFPKFILSPSLVDEVFAVLECYFPVDFTPSSKFSIRREDLKEGLEVCLSCSDQFIPHCLTLITEKLESKLKVAHLDSLQLFVRLCKVRLGEDLSGYFVTLWDLTKDLLLVNTDAEVQACTMEAISVAIKSVAASSQNPNASLEPLLEAIISRSKVLLSDPSESVYSRASKLCGAIAMASPLSAEHIISNLVPQLLTLLQFERIASGQILETLIPLLTASVKFDLWNTGSDEAKSLLVKIPEALFKYLQNPLSRKGCIECFKEISSQLPKEDRTALLNYFVSTTTDNTYASVECELLKELATNNPEEVKEFLQQLTFDGDKNLSEFERNSDLLVWSCHSLPLTGFCVDKLTSLLSTKHPDKILKKLKYVCENGNDAVLRYTHEDCRIVQKVISFCVQACELKNLTEDNLTNSAIIIKLVTSNLDEKNQLELVSECLTTYYSSFTLKENYELETLEKNIIPFEGLMGGLRPNVIIPNISEVVQCLLVVSLKGIGELQRMSSNRLIASLLNKAGEETVETVLKLVEEQLDSVLGGSEAERGVSVVAWISKALLLRTHPSYHHWIEKLMSFLSSQEVGFQAAQGFEIILTDSADFLNKSCHTRIGVLYKQRLFEYVTKILSLLDDSVNENKDAVCMALAYFLKFSPQQLIINRLEELIKIIVKCLDSESVSIVASTLEVTSILLQSKNEFFESYINTFIPRCLTLATSPFMNVRLEALNCIYLLSNCTEMIVLPYRQKVLSGLVPCLDDKKRLVRKKAVQARTCWYLLGST